MFFYFERERFTAAIPPGEEGVEIGLLVVVVVVSVVLAVVGGATLEGAVVVGTFFTSWLRLASCGGRDCTVTLMSRTSVPLKVEEKQGKKKKKKK
jgi:hypothetical protein